MINAFSSNCIDQVTLFNIQMINMIFSGISILGSAFVFFSFIFIKDIRTFPTELVVWLCISNCITNISFFINIDSNIIEETYKITKSCEIQGFLQMIFDNSAMIFATLIGYTAYYTAIDYDQIKRNTNRLRIYYLMIAFIVPLILSITVFLFKDFGPSGAWCWLDLYNEDKKDTVTVFLFVSYGIYWIFIITNCYYIIKVIIILRKEHEDEKMIAEMYTKMFIRYPIVMILCLAPSTINRIVSYSINYECNNLRIILYYFQTTIDSSQGFIFAIIFGLNSSLKDFFVNSCSSYFGTKNSLKQLQIRKDIKNVENAESFVSKDEFTPNLKNHEINNVLIH